MNYLLTKAGAPVDGVLQEETATIAGTVTQSGNASVIVTAAGMTDSPITLSVPVTGGTAQAETATVVGTIGASGAGNVSVVVRAVGMTGTPKTVSVAVANNDTAAQVAGKIRTALIADADVGDVSTGFFTVTGTGANIILTAKVQAADDATMNIAIDNGTATGLTAAPTSTSTTPGSVGNTATDVAALIRSAFKANGTIRSFFTIGGTGADVTLTRVQSGADDATLNIAFADDTSDGLTDDATSTTTIAGVAGSYRGAETGQKLADTTNFTLYQNTGTSNRPVWSLL